MVAKSVTDRNLQKIYKNDLHIYPGCLSFHLEGWFHLVLQVYNVIHIIDRTSIIMFKSILKIFGQSLPLPCFDYFGD